MKRALYAFSGDPITLGHIDIIKRAAMIFDELVVAIGVNPDKQYLFSLEERTALAEEALRAYENVRVVSFQGLLVDFAYELNIPILVKGVRSVSDFEYENLLHRVGESQKLGIETVVLLTKPELAHVSSSMVKAVQKEQGLIHEYVPLAVKKALEAKVSGQRIVGVTGEIGMGKSFVSEALVEIGKQRGIPVHHIEMDEIGHEILHKLTEPMYQEVRDILFKEFGDSIRTETGAVDRKALGDIVFQDSIKMQRLNEIMYTPLLVRLRRTLYGKKGLILLNAALLAESRLSELSNNEVILVHSSEELQQERLSARQLTADQIKTRLDSQFDTLRKRQELQAAIDFSHQGRIWEVTSENESVYAALEQIFDQLVADF